MMVEQNQPEVYRVLRNSILKDRLSHAYLFEGDTGVGKKVAALFLSKAILCTSEEKPCGICSNCSRIANGIHPDVMFVAPDGQSIKKEQVLSMHEEFKKKALEENSKIFIISDADKMTTSAGNSMLKFIEEPYVDTTIILLTDAKNIILPTIISRCQVISFKELNKVQLAKRIEVEGIDATRAKVLACFTNNVESAVKMNDEWFDEALKVAFKMFLQRKNVLAAITIVQSEWMSTFDSKPRMKLGLEMLIIMYRDLLLVKYGKTNEVINSEFIERYERESTMISEEKIAGNITKILEAQMKMKANVHNQLLMDQLAIRLG